jgi:hypothetical protein
MAIPGFRADGTLPPGEYRATWPEIVGRYGWNARRRALLAGLRLALSELQRAGCERVYVDGSFVTEKDEPNDYDCCWEEAGVAIPSLHAGLLDLRWPRATMNATFGGEMFPANAFADAQLTRYRTFFQRDRDDEPKGIIFIDLTEVSL